MKYVLIMIFFVNPDQPVASGAHSIVFESRDACLNAARATFKATGVTTFCEPLRSEEVEE